MSRLDSLLLRAAYSIYSGQSAMSGKDKDEILADLAACRCEQGVCVLDCPTCPKAMPDYRPFIHRLATSGIRDSRSNG